MKSEKEIDLGVYLKGDRKKQEEALVELTPLVRGIARALAHGDLRLREDLVQEGFLSLILAASSYKPERGPFSAFARRCARNRMISYLRRLRPILPLTDEEADDLSFEPRNDEKIDLNSARDSLIQLLSPFELVCLDAYLHTGSGSGAAELLGWESKKVENALTRIKGKAKSLRENPYARQGATPSGQEPDVSLQ